MVKGPVKKVKMGMSNTYLVRGDEGFILIDAGLKGKSGSLYRVLNDLNAYISDIELIVITHVHSDHVGDLKELKESTGADVLVHRDGADRLSDGYAEIPDGTSSFTKIITGAMGLFSTGTSFDAVDPDIVIDDHLDLSSYGIQGDVIHTPGHTSESICVIIEDRYCISGDTFFNSFLFRIYPPLAEDEKMLIESWKKIADYDCDYYYPGHGDMFTKEKFLKYYEKHVEAQDK